MNMMTEQMAKIVASVKTTAWGGGIGSLALFLYKYGYITVTRYSLETIDQLSKADPVNKAITVFLTPFETLSSKNRKRSKMQLTNYRRRQRASKLNGLSNALKKNMWKISTRNTPALRTDP